MAEATHRQSDVEEIWRRKGFPLLPTKAQFKIFTRKVAAALNFGVPAWGIVAEEGWGVRINSTGPTSADTLRFKDVQAIDIAPGSGSPGWGERPDNEKFHWLTFDPEDYGFGVGRAPAQREDLPNTEPLPPPPPPPLPPSQDNLFGVFGRDLRPFFRGDVSTHAMFDSLIRRVREEMGQPIVESEWPDYRAVAWWRYWNGTHVRDTVTHDFGQTFQNDGGGRWTTLEAKLRDFWGAGPQPIPPARSLLEFARGELVGHFLAGPLYFAPSYCIRSEAHFRRACQWFKDNGYNCAMWMNEQTHWGEHGDRDPTWTDPGPDGAPLVHVSPDGLRTFGWPLEEQLRRIRIMRAEYGLHVVGSLWEQGRVEYDFDFAIDNSPRVIQALDADVIAWFNTWEEDEILDPEQEHRLNNVIARVAWKPSGPHHAGGVPGASYWFGDQSRIYWHQSARDGDLRAQAEESVRICSENNVVSIGFEHSGMLPSHHRPVHTLEECKERGRLVVAAGEHMSLSG